MISTSTFVSFRNISPAFQYASVNCEIQPSRPFANLYIDVFIISQLSVWHITFVVLQYTHVHFAHLHIFISNSESVSSSLKLQFISLYSSISQIFTQHLHINTDVFKVKYEKLWWQCRKAFRNFWFESRTLKSTTKVWQNKSHPWYRMFLGWMLILNVLLFRNSV